MMTNQLDQGRKFDQLWPRAKADHQLKMRHRAFSGDDFFVFASVQNDHIFWQFFVFVGRNKALECATHFHVLALLSDLNQHLIKVGHLLAALRLFFGDEDLFVFGLVYTIIINGQLFK